MVDYREATSAWSIRIRSSFESSQPIALIFSIAWRTFFAPGIGIPEDPVTGSAHCCLGPYWRKRIGKDKMTAFQASKRGGLLTVEVNGDRVLIGGKAVTVFCAELKEG
jgi:predicted PhzF superfamily epimerase YddE/YHI9